MTIPNPKLQNVASLSSRAVTVQLDKPLIPLVGSTQLSANKAVKPGLHSVGCVFHCHGFMPVGHMGETVGMRRRCSKLTASCEVQIFNMLFCCVLKGSSIRSVFPSVFASISCPKLPRAPVLFFFLHCTFQLGQVDS